MRDDIPDSIEARARRRVRRKLGFYKHAIVFVVVNLALFALSELTGRHFNRMAFMAWGIVLLIHGVLAVVSLQSEGLRERMIRQEIERMRRERDNEADKQ
jgi:hypothetical protein